MVEDEEAKEGEISEETEFDIETATKLSDNATIALYQKELMLKKMELEHDLKKHGRKKSFWQFIATTGIGALTTIIALFI